MNPIHACENDHKIDFEKLLSPNIYCRKSEAILIKHDGGPSMEKHSVSQRILNFRSKMNVFHAPQPYITKNGQS